MKAQHTLRSGHLLLQVIVKERNQVLKDLL